MIIIDTIGDFTFMNSCTGIINVGSKVGYAPSPSGVYKTTATLSASEGVSSDILVPCGT